MVLTQRDFHHDKTKAVKLLLVCGFTPLEDIARNNSIQSVRSLCVNRANADYLISNGGENINLTI